MLIVKLEYVNCVCAGAPLGSGLGYGFIATDGRSSGNGFGCEWRLGETSGKGNGYGDGVANGNGKRKSDDEI